MPFTLKKVPFSPGFGIAIALASFAALAPMPAAAQTELVFCYDVYPPYAIGEEGAPQGGMKVDLLTAVTDQIDDLTATVVLMPWKRCQTQARAGDVDGILPLFRNDDRETYLEFSTVTHQEASALFYDRQSFPDGLSWTGDYADLAHLRLGMLNGSFIDTEMEAAFSQGQEITRARDVETLLKLLTKGRVDLIAVEKNVGHFTAEQNGWGERVAATEPVISQRSSQFGLSKASGADRYVEAFNEAIRGLSQSGEIDRIFRNSP